MLNQGKIYIHIKFIKNRLAVSWVGTNVHTHSLTINIIKSAGTHILEDV